MRQGILGLLALGWIGLQGAHGQTGAYQEPLPVQSQGVQPGVGFAPPAPSRFPNYVPATYPGYGPAPTYAPPAAGYWAPPPRYAFQPAPAPAYPMPGPAYGAPRPGFLPQAAVMPVSAQNQQPEPLPAPMPVVPMPVTQPSAPQAAAQPAAPQEVVSEPVIVDSGLPAEPPEPYMAAPEGNWRPHKGARIYGTAEYLRWQIPAQPLVPTLSLSVSQPKVVPVLANEYQNGARFTLGMWLNDYRNVAIEGSYSFLLTGGSFNQLTFPPVKLTAKPIFDGVVGESSIVSTETSFSTAELNGRYHACDLECCGGVLRLDFLGGLRFTNLSENLTIRGTSSFGTAPVLLSDTTVVSIDSFGTHNHLFAGQVGVDTGLSWRRLSLNAYGKLALGDNVETVHINGITQVAGPPVVGTFTATGGFFAQPSNIGGYQRQAFDVMTEWGVNMGYQLCGWCRLGMGYSMAYLTHAIRPGDQFDPTTAGAAARPALFFVGGPRPLPQFNNFNETGFWAQGISFTVELSF